MRRLILYSVCLFAVLGLSCVAPSSFAFARQKTRVVEKHASAVAGRKHTSATTKKKQESSAAKRGKTAAVVNREPATDPQPRTPTDKQDCIAVAQDFYKRAGALARRTKQPIPPAFVRVVSKLDEFCGEEEFDKARISIDWMNTCLQSFSSEPKAAACSNSESQLCAVDSQSNACPADKRLAEY